MLKYIDIFGYKPSFYIHNDKAYKTNFGGILVILLLGITIFSSMYYAKDIFYKQNPSTIYTEEFTNSPPPFIFSKTQKNIAAVLYNNKS